MEVFLNMVATFCPLSEESRQALGAALQEHRLPKGRCLIRPAAICDRIFFVEKGLTRTFYDKDGRDVTDWLSAEGSFVVSVISFLTRQPDRRGVELLEDSVLWSVSAADLETLYTRHHELERLGRLLVSHGLVQVQQRMDALHFTGAADRYAQLMREQPGLLLRVPMNMIASYLGMSPETLSRIRAAY